MEDVAKHPWLFERNEKDGTRRFYLRVRVPKDLTKALGKKEIKKSLRTADRQIALGRIKSEAAEVQELFDAARRTQAADPPPPLTIAHGGSTEESATSLTRAQVSQIVQVWFDREEQNLILEANANLGTLRYDLGEAVADLKYDEGMFLSPHEEQWAPIIQPIVNSILEEHSFAVDPSTDAYWELCGLVKRGLALGARRQQARIQGDFTAKHDSFFDGVSTALDAAGHQSPVEEVIHQSPAVSEASAAFVLDHQMKWSAKTKNDYEAKLRLFVEIIGDKPIINIKRPDGLRFQEVVKMLPANWMKKPALRDFAAAAAAEAAAAQGLAPMSDTSVSKHMTRVGQLFNWAKDERDHWGVTANPLRKLQIKVNTMAREERHSFSI